MQHTIFDVQKERVRELLEFTTHSFRNGVVRGGTGRQQNGPLVPQPTRTDATSAPRQAINRLSTLPPRGRTFLSGFESTHLPGPGVDLFDITGHAGRWREDLDAVLAAGVRHFRYPLRWPRIESSPGRYDWRETDEVLGYLHDAGAVPIVDLVHHTSYPGWLTDGFRDPAFAPAYLRYAEVVARRYPFISAYTLFNEPFATLFLSGHEGLWPPYDRGMTGFVRALQSVLPAISTAAQCFSDLLPDAAHVWVDTAEHHRGTGPGADYADLANDRRHSVLDLMTDHDVDPGRPFLRELAAAGGESLFGLPPLRVDLLGLDYYCHSEWFYDAQGSHAPSREPIGLAALAQLYGDRYGLPMMLTETNIRGLPTDRVNWLKYTLEQYEIALDAGVDLRGYCWFPQVDSCDWDSLLARGAGRVDPVGVVSLTPDHEPVRTEFTAWWERAARGLPAAAIPAYRLQEPCATQLQGLAEATSHWHPVDPPATETVPPQWVPVQSQKGRTDMTTPTPDLVVLSHLRWSWVWQRPQHLVSRLAALRAGSGARTWFVEEPSVGNVREPELRIENHPGITRVWLEIPCPAEGPRDIAFGDPGTDSYGDRLAELLAEHGRPARPDIWLYTPMAFDVAQPLNGGRLIFDVMDDLAAFKQAPPGLVLAHRRALAEADVVFTGGRSLHRGVLAQRRRDVHLFPSGVDQAHYASSRELRTAHDRPVAGYVGVIDERVDLSLIGELAARLPDWTVRVVGPVAKIDPASLPQAANIEYPGFARYEELPAVMAGFDVGIMPFAINAATKAISPTKTLEYLAAGLPVVSTRIDDVVADYGDVVRLAADPVGFAAACGQAAGRRQPARERRISALLRSQEWDAIAAAMNAHIDDIRLPHTVVTDQEQEVSA